MCIHYTAYVHKHYTGNVCIIYGVYTQASLKTKSMGSFLRVGCGLSIKEASVPSLWELQGEDNISQGGPVQEHIKKLNIRHQ